MENIFYAPKSNIPFKTHYKFSIYWFAKYPVVDTSLKTFFSWGLSRGVAHFYCFIESYWTIAKNIGRQII